MKEDRIQIKTSHVLVLFFLLSLLGHILIGTLIWYYEPLLVRNAQDSQESKELVVLKTKVLSEDEFQRRIVETTRAKTSQPEDLNIPAKYHGEFTQRVEKESVAKGFGSSNMERTGSPEKPKASHPAKKAESSSPKLSALERFGKVPLILPEEAEEESETEEERAKNSSSPTGELGSGNLDFLEKEVAIGGQTLLNTDEYKFAGFFNRFKREVAPRWEPMIQRVLLKQGRQIKKGTYETRTRFTLDSDGTILGVDILSSSGIAAFDEAAKSSIMQVLRIKNPPQALREGDGKFRIELGFMVNLENLATVFNYVPDPRLPESQR